MAKKAVTPTRSSGAKAAPLTSRSSSRTTSTPKPQSKAGKEDEKPETPALDAIQGFDDWLNVQDLAEEMITLQKQRSRLDDQIKEKAALVNAYMSSFKDDSSWSGKLPSGAGTVCYIKPKPRKTLVRELLIQKGVSLKVIEASTRETPVTPFVTVIPAGEKKAGIPVGED